MKLLEYESKELFGAYRIPVPPCGGVIRAAAQLPAALRRAGKGPWVLKAQVLAGGRGKAGGIKLARTPAEARQAAKSILGMTLTTHQTQGQGLKVRELLVEGGARIERELYLSVVMDRKTAGPVVIASAEGGMEIERLAAERPEAILRQPVDPDAGLPDFAARRLAFQLGLPAGRIGDFCHVVKSLVRLFLEHDCSLAEVNPLVLTPKGLMALDGKVVADDNALFRHLELFKRKDPELSALEREAKKADLSYIALDGSIGCMVNGAGLAMGTMDTIALAGGRPANFLDVGGSADEQRVTRAFQIILKDPKVKAVLVNIFGGIVKCDMIASGILAALKKVKLGVPLVVRLQGTNVDKGREILSQAPVKIIAAQDLWDAAQKAVEAAR
ncbi:MAG TPA: ADP-forming succinate--CoA ligase subunit beta [Elusimicrobia bacterium]|nr:ADP-forming succinate--CoA ligase subunit beta [Elusimicrobiota bacterium]HBT60943.1 ADP-forming succinate--CoA ligase subunit beta [Elusimicrobiota bacterium]